MLRCIVIDDEDHAVKGLEKYISTVSRLELVKSYTDPLKALVEILAGDPVDLILLDVDMPQISGLELSKEIRRKTNKLVFTTGFTKYAYDAFESDADAYLLKPYSLGKFLITINKLFPEQEESDAQKSKDDFFFVKSKDDNLKILKIRYEDVIAVESKMNYIMIHTPEKNVLTYMSLTEISKLLSALPEFIQFQRSFILNQNHIDSIDGNTIKMNKGIEITVGDHYRKDFASFVAGKLIKAGKKK
ncbi:LytR/AlgR family response regulator transcription factor [Pedobacter metabolipauper]|uniref:LytTR family two component transcriptional regulator n=1 Tax=Pedobacter metabolipauper TaxID=425513 RepID=A0A4V3D0M5_9SPHI|nr:LytTR family DNA-binding domain-containing protein [Pedobacter metabolipauper]TDQ06480.1 LytTR family two component transcriptional regulator [Pedobacter metabolipauper]